MRLTSAATWCLLCHVATTAVAQCTTQWTGGHRLTGVDGEVVATVEWDRDGAGPAPALWVVGGTLRGAGDAVVDNLAAYDASSDTWTPLGGGVSGTVNALAVLPNGDLVVGGAFLAAGGAPASRVARWNGTTWSAMASGVDGDVFALLPLPNGELLVGGDFATAGGIAAPGIARWDGTAWSHFGTSPRVRGLARTPAGGLFAAGGDPSFTAGYVREWNGTAWQTIATPNGVVRAALALPNGSVVFGGNFSLIGTIGTIFANSIAAWTGTAWQAFGSGITGTVHALVGLPNGDLVAGGTFQGSASVIARNVARWNGSAWSKIGGGVNDHFNGVVPALALAGNGDLLAAGTFSFAPSLRTRSMARWNGAFWAKPCHGTDGLVLAVQPLANGDVIVGGAFTEIDGFSAQGLARWTAAGWAGYGSGPGDVNAVTTLADGTLVVAVMQSPALTCIIQRWTGSGWQSLGVTDSGVNTMLGMPNGELMVGGLFTAVSGVAAARIARWNGAWSPLGSGLTGGSAITLLALPNGDLFVGGGFTAAGGIFARNIARFDGAAWHALASGLTGPFSFASGLAHGPAGTVLAAGQFSAAGGIASTGFAIWDGTAWSVPAGALLNGGSPGHAFAVTALPDGDVVVSGGFTHVGTTPAAGIARWDGGSWSAFGAGTSLPGARLLRWDARGNLLVAGGLQAAGGQVAAEFVRLVSTCPASSVPMGAGCTGSGGVNALTTTALPWLGATFRGETTGMPATGLALAAFGFAPVAVPLAAILPQGVAGCLLLVVPDLLATYAPLAGKVATELTLPNTPSLVGIVVHHQVIAIELTPGGDIQALTSSNALRLTLGSF